LPAVSATGHVWTTLDQGDGSPIRSYGFAPEATHERSPFAPGNVYIDDNTNYTNNGQTAPYYSRKIEVTQAQFDAMKNFGETTRLAPTDTLVSVKDVNGNDQNFNLHYNGLNNSCIDYSWKFLEIGGLNPNAYQGAIWPTWNKKFFDSIIDQIEKNGPSLPDTSVPPGGSSENLIDENGHLTSSVVKDADGNLVSETDYSYGLNGDTINVTYKDAGGAQTNSVVITESGGVSRMEVYDAGNQLQSTTTAQTFDDGTSLATVSYPSGTQTVISTDLVNNITQTDYPAPENPQIQTITARDRTGTVTATRTITPSLDEENNPIANTYDTLTLDGAGRQLSSGTLQVNPIDGSLTESVYTPPAAGEFFGGV
jgi:hypothetical protein